MERYREIDKSVLFLKHGFIFHKLFRRTYAGMTIPQARAKMRKRYTHSQQDEIIHYLKEQNLLIDSYFNQ